MNTAYTDHDFTPVADRILYEDDHMLVVNKQAGEVVHKSKMAHNVSSVLIYELRALLGPDVYPVHRLDRKTSGALIFARHAEAARAIQAVFIEGQIKKTYGAIVRGFVPESFALDSPMENDRGKMQDALTIGERVRHFEIDLPHNMAPSLHVVYCGLILLTMVSDNKGILIKSVYISWLILICLSTLFVHQHHILDVAAGLILAVFLRRRMTGSKEDFEQKESSGKDDNLQMENADV